MVDQNEPRNRWGQMKEKIKGNWEDISDEELEATKGNISEISNLILHKYGQTKQYVVRRLVDIMHTLDDYEVFKLQLGTDLNHRT